MRRRRLGDDVNDAVVIDDELLPTPAKAGTSARKTTRRSAPQGSPPSSPEPHSEDKEEKEKKAVEKAENGDGRKTHRRTSSWSSRVFGGPFVSSFVGSSKTPEEVDAERAAREARRASKAADIAARKFARDESKRAKRELIRRATEEERMFRAVLEETKRAAAESLPRRRGESAAHAACVLVTPGGLRGGGRVPGGRGVGEGRLEPPVGPGGKRNLASALDDVADEATAPIGNAEVAGSNPDGDGATRSAARADRGGPVEPTLSTGAHPATATASDTSDAAAAADDEPAKIPADAFFASLDQMSANGQGACTLACVALAGGWRTTRARSGGGRGWRSRHARMSTSRGRTRRRPNLRPTPPPTTAAAAVDPSSCSTRSSREPRRRGGRCAPTRRCSSASPTDTSTSTPRSSVTCRFPSPTPRGGCESTPRWVTPPIGRPHVIVRAGFGWTTASLSSAFSLRPVRGPGSPTLDALVAAAPPLRTIVDELARTAPATYVVSWLDHFFVLRFRGGDAFATPPRFGKSKSVKSIIEAEEDEEVGYVMDSLGERLCEGCKRGYVLRCDGSSSTGRDGDGGPAAADSLGASSASRQIGADVAAYASGVKGAREPSPEQLMRRLQIEFHRVRRG